MVSVSKFLNRGQDPFPVGLTKALDRVVEAADLLDEMLHVFPDGGDLVSEIREHRGQVESDVNSVEKELSQTFVTVIEPEDVQQLNRNVNELSGVIEDVATWVSLCRSDAAKHEASRLTRILLESVRENQRASSELREHGLAKFSEPETLHHSREARGTRANGLRAILDAKVEPEDLVLWKDAIDRLTGGVATSQRLSQLLSAIATKHL